MAEIQAIGTTVMQTQTQSYGGEAIERTCVVPLRYWILSLKKFLKSGRMLSSMKIRHLKNTFYPHPYGITRSLKLKQTGFFKDWFLKGKIKVKHTMNDS